MSRIRRRCHTQSSAGTVLKSTMASRTASISGVSAGQAASQARIRSSSAAKLPHGTSFLDAKYRKKVRRPMPAALAMSSTVVPSKPCRSNSSNATCSSSARVVIRLRPSWAGAPGEVISATASLAAPPRACHEMALSAKTLGRTQGALDVQILRRHPAGPLAQGTL